MSVNAPVRDAVMPSRLALAYPSASGTFSSERDSTAFWSAVSACSVSAFMAFARVMARSASSTTSFALSYDSLRERVNASLVISAVFLYALSSKDLFASARLVLSSATSTPRSPAALIAFASSTRSSLAL